MLCSTMTRAPRSTKWFVSLAIFPPLNFFLTAICSSSQMITKMSPDEVDAVLAAHKLAKS